MQFSEKPSFIRFAINISAWIAILALSVASAFFAYAWSERKGYAYLENASSHQLDLYVASLESELGKHEYLPSLMELDLDVLSLLADRRSIPLRDKVNKRLANLNVRAGSVAVFIIDTQGIVRASSNWYQPGTFVGMDFSDMPYFSEAIKEGHARFFSPNTMRDSPEYYFGQSIRRDGRVIGVAVVKVSLAPIESAWTASIAHSQSEKFFVVDSNDLVIISSVQDWKYKPTTLLSSMLRAKLATAKQHSLEVIEPFGMGIERSLAHNNHLVRLLALNPVAPEPLYMAQDRFMMRTGWRFVTLSDVSDVLHNARYTALGAGALTAFSGLLGMYLMQRRRAIANQLAAREALQKAHDELELKVAERTDELHRTNKDLVREITERKRTEQTLREAQDELVQASKLALLGQMAAGITHEINQPLTALRALSHNTRLLLKRDCTERIDKNLQSITDITERMGRITEQLKSFARKAPLTIGPILLSGSVSNALLLLENRMQSEQVELQIDVPVSLRALCDGNRLEQVLINLFANALDAMKDAPSMTLSIKAWATADRALIRVTDGGPGIPEAVMSRLFEPFFTTKPPGKGLGLGLAISAGIVREFGGTLRAENIPGGAAFEFDLKLAEENHHV